MSFLSELKVQKQKLKETETVVTNVDGVKYIEGSNKHRTEIIERNSYGFVVDTKPDDVPALVVDYVYIGSQDCAESKVIDNYNIKHVLSLGIDINAAAVNHKFVPILDLPESDIKPVLKICLPFICNAVEMKENILIHCNAGVSRTAMVVIAYLMQYLKMEFEDAYSLVKARRPAIQPNTGFRKQLQYLKSGNVV